MQPRVTTVFIESADVPRLVNFWAELLQAPSGVDPESGWGQVVADSICIGAKPVTESELPDLEKGSRVHLDILIDNLALETERALSLGATVKRGPFGDEDTGQYTVFADIDGNAFCLYSDPLQTHASIIEAIRNGTIGQSGE